MKLRVGYYVSCKPYYKFGSTNNLYRRWCGYQSHNPLAKLDWFVVGPLKDIEVFEARMHKLMGLKVKTHWGNWYEWAKVPVTPDQADFHRLPIYLITRPAAVAMALKYDGPLHWQFVELVCEANGTK